MSRLRIATRGSALALAQAGAVAERLSRAMGTATELVVVKTTGDRLIGSLAKHGGKGLFVTEVEETLLSGRADLAVHSAKDLPAELSPGLSLVAFPERADPRDALVTRQPGLGVDTLPKGARVGTGSLRRRSLLLSRRPDLDIEPLRGNVDTRLGKLDSEGLDAVVLACAGLERLGLAERIGERIDLEALLPAPAQGTLALEAREGETLGSEVAAVLDDPATHRATLAERAFLARLGGDCNVPLAAHASASAGGGIALQGALASLDGSRVLRARAESAATHPESAGRTAADAILADGGEALLAAIAAGTQAPA